MKYKEIWAISVIIIITVIIIIIIIIIIIVIIMKHILFSIFPQQRGL